MQKSSKVLNLIKNLPKKHKDYIRALHFHPEGNILFISGHDGLLGVHKIGKTFEIEPNSEFESISKEKSAILT
jgi:hypothetical protein